MEQAKPAVFGIDFYKTFWIVQYTNHNSDDFLV